MKALKIPDKKPRSRKDMTNYLVGHFRYDTMNSWNRATSYAHNIKLRHINVPPDYSDDALWESLEIPAVHEISGFNEILYDFDYRHDHAWQIGTNGRSGGYLVLYQGGAKPSDYKSYCTECGQRNYKVATDGDNQCGRCHEFTRENYQQAPRQIFTYPGRGLDMDEDFEEWHLDDLRSRVNLVWDFDQTCERAVQAYLDFAQTHRPEKRIISRPTEITVAVPR